MDQRQEALKAIADRIAKEYFHALAPNFRPPAHLICPTDAAEEVVLQALKHEGAERKIPVEVIDLRQDAAARLNDVTARIIEGKTVKPQEFLGMLILRRFDVFGDKKHEDPTYPFRSEFQHDQSFLWLFTGRDPDRMRFLFGSYSRPLYMAAGSITPEEWRV